MPAPTTAMSVAAIGRMHRRAAGDAGGSNTTSPSTTVRRTGTSGSSSGGHVDGIGAEPGQVGAHARGDAAVDVLLADHAGRLGRVALERLESR